MSSIEQEVREWPGVTIREHDRGGREFTLDERELGHIHGESLLDIPFTKRIRTILVSEGRAEKHHVVPDSGWVSYRIDDDEDSTGAIWLLRLSYCYHVLATADETWKERIDIEAELDSLEPSDELRNVFEAIGDI
ncbi:luciferase domain-containing protein [Halocatena halophila]|uniref:luciferase domain-containing protein n=1 Tax=Halocatena halophila TaxID=2814576 RepID=UPI002ED0CBBB